MLLLLQMLMTSIPLKLLMCGHSCQHVSYMTLGLFTMLWAALIRPLTSASIAWACLSCR